VAEAPVAEAPVVQAPVAEEESVAPRRGVRGVFARWFGRKAQAAAQAPAVEEPADEAVTQTAAQAPAVEESADEPVTQATVAVQATVTGQEPSAAGQPEADPAPDPAELLDGMLGSLGAAHHRPFSR
jgi:hypothetical protein